MSRCLFSALRFFEIYIIALNTFLYSFLSYITNRVSPRDDAHPPTIWVCNRILAKLKSCLDRFYTAVYKILYVFIRKFDSSLQSAPVNI